MNKEKISTFGLSADQYQLVGDSIWDSSIEVYQEKSPVDTIMKRRIFALIMNLDQSNQEERDFLQCYYEDLIWFPETLIFIGEYKPNWNVKGRVIYSSTLSDLAPNLRLILQVAYSKTQKNENFTQGLIRSFQLSREIKNRPGVTTASLSEDLSLSEHLINWYILLLQSANELIEYNQETGGWNYFDDGEHGSLEGIIRSELAIQAMRNELEGWIEYKDSSVQIVNRIESESNKR